MGNHQIDAGASSDPLFRTAAYRFSIQLIQNCWVDANTLYRNPVTNRISSQLYRAVGSVAANLAEGYSRRSKHDRARLYEYALGSAREARVWYSAGRPVLGTEVVAIRLDLIDNISRLLVGMIASERARISAELGPDKH